MRHARAFAAALAVAAVLAAVPLAAPPRAQDDMDNVAREPMDPIDLGILVFRELGNCQLCHGWNGGGGMEVMLENGNLLDPGPSLEKSKMTAEQMVEIVSCGKVLSNNMMPAYLFEAWKPEHPCYGKTEADLPDTERPPAWGVPLYPEEVDAVVLWVQLAYQGKPLTLELCIRYFGFESRGCDTLR